jgi:proline dehydrogenase
VNWFNKIIALALPYIPKPIVGFFSRHYIAGDKLENAINLVKDLNQQGMCATIDVLGEKVTQPEHSVEAVNMYKLVLKTLEEEKLDANVSVKPTHMGLKIDKDFCFENIKSLVEEAEKRNNFVRIDMEDASCTDDTINIYLQLRKDYQKVGTVLQSYLRRTLDDINHLIPHQPNLRYCKGIYNESRMISYKDKYIINKNYEYGLEKILKKECYVGIATHDEKLIWHALRLIDELRLKNDRYEFQMLLGVDPELRRILVAEGHRLRVYVPFGKEWFAYSTRRLKENPAIAGYIIKGIIERMLGKKQ